jgi:uncharacterized membrane protein
MSQELRGEGRWRVAPLIWYFDIAPAYGDGISDVALIGCIIFSILCGAVFFAWERSRMGPDERERNRVTLKNWPWVVTILMIVGLVSAAVNLLRKFALG